MNTEYSPDQKRITEFVERLAKKYDRAYWTSKAETKYFLDEMWAEIADNGYLGITIPEAYGGSNLNYSDLAVLLEELAKHGIATLHFISFFMACILVTRHGNERLKAEVLPQLGSGTYASFAITEPDAGSNSLSIRTLAVKKGKDFTISGQKVFITGADESKFMVVVARTVPYDKTIDKRKGISLFLVDSNAEGIEKQAQDIQIISPERQYTVFFDNVRVPAWRLIGQEGNGVNCVFDGLNLERIMVAAYCIGWGRYVLRKAIKYAKERNIFGDPIGKYQAIQHPLARRYLGLQLAGVATQIAARALDENRENEIVGLYANAAKLTASEEAHGVCDIAIQLHGGSAFTKECEILNISNMLRVARVGPVNNELILSYIAHKHLGLPRSY